MDSTTTSNETMGKVIVTMNLTNRVDQVLAERGIIQSEQVRTITVSMFMKDLSLLLRDAKGATTAWHCLPDKHLYWV